MLARGALGAEQMITDILGHLEAACNIAHEMKQWGTITADEYERHFNSVIARMEDRVHSLWKPYLREE